jgi:hypothetical protein
MARSTESALKEMKTWTDRLGHSGLRSFTDADGHLWLEQNSAKASKWTNLARKGHDIAWEFGKPGGGYTGRMLIDGEIYTPREATKTFLKVAKICSGAVEEGPVDTRSKSIRCTGRDLSASIACSPQILHCAIAVSTSMRNGPCPLRMQRLDRLVLR